MSPFFVSVVASDVHCYFVKVISYDNVKFKEVFQNTGGDVILLAACALKSITELH
jgi:hypothetical protein